jgi:hypothetical protein
LIRRSILGRISRNIAKSASFSVFLFSLGCSPNPTQQDATPATAPTPSITQVLPQTIPAGSQSTTLKVTGTNFVPETAILWNGAALATTVIDANTLSGTIGSNSLTTPGAVQLQVQNTQTLQESEAVPITIAASTEASSPLAISTTTLPQGIVSTAYSFSLAAAGGTSPYNWSITAGQLPPGLNLAADTGIISGTPSSSGNYSVAVTVVDSSSPAQSATAYSVPMSIAAATSDPLSPLSITTTTLPQGTVSTAYTVSLAASGGSSPYQWTISAGQLPPGVNLAANTGIVSGTPTSSGTYSVDIAATDASSPVQSATVHAVQITINAASIQPSSSLAISTTALPQGVVSVAYSVSLAASGGTSPYQWSITSGQLPAGLNLTGNSGTISGTPTASGNYSVGITAKDLSTPVQSSTATVSLSVAAAPSQPAPLVINSATMAAGTLGLTYSNNLQASGGIAPYTWSINSGSLPAGLGLSSKTGLISGTPTASGTSGFTASVTDSSSPAQSKSAVLSLVVAPAALAITSPSTLPSAKVNSSYSNTLQATGGRAPYTWSISTGTLPAGINLAANTGVLSGTPTSSGSFSVAITAVDSSSPTQSATEVVDLAVQGSANTLTNLQKDSWVSSGQVSPSYADCNQSCPGLTFSMSEGITSPSLSGSAAQWNLGGTNPFSDVLFIDHLIGAFSTHGLPDPKLALISTLHNFTYDLYFYPTDPTHTQAMEFDINMSMNSVGMTWSTECRMAGGNEWDVWDNVTKHWIPTGFACYPLANAWNHVTVTGQRGPNNTVIYETITLNGVVNNINQTYAPYVVPSDWYGITVNYQMDGDKNQTSIKSYSDNMSFTYW